MVVYDILLEAVGRHCRNAGRYPTRNSGGKTYGTSDLQCIRCGVVTELKVKRGSHTLCEFLRRDGMGRYSAIRRKGELSCSAMNRPRDPTD